MNEKKKQKSIFGYIFQFAGDFKNQYIKSIVLAFVGVIFSLVPFFILGNILTMLLSGNKNFDDYVSLLIFMGASLVLRVVFHTSSTNLSHKTTFRLLGNIRSEICDKLARLPLGTVLDIPSGSLKNTIVERVDNMEPTLAHVIPEFTANLTAPVFIFAYLLKLDWRMALLSLATIPVGFLGMAMMMKDYKVRFQRTQDTTKVLNETAVEYINGIEVIKAFGKTESSYKRFAKAAEDNALSFVDWMKSVIGPHAVSMTIMPATLLPVLPIGAIFTMNGSISITDFLMIVVLSLGLLTPLITAASFFDDIGKATSIFGEIDKILELTELDRPEKSEALPKNHDIELSGVHFSYNEKEVLHGIDLDIKEGTVTALVGPSGSGKSTIARLIASLWDVKDGSIKIGGVDIRKMSLDDFNSQVAYVSQTTFLFDATVRENIRMGNPKASDKEVEDIAKLAGCYDFIMSLEKGFETMVGSGGAHLSGGEKQRISIARAMLKNAPILILDEATAYTDPENEAIIQNSVAHLAKGKTLIVIAHRLSTVVESDKIVVINDGKVESKGKHSELLENSKLYKNMWQAHIVSKDTAEVSV